MGRSFVHFTNGKPLSSQCFRGEHDLKCARLQCCCKCHDWEPVEDRNITSEVILDRQQEGLLVQE